MEKQDIYSKLFAFKEKELKLKKDKKAFNYYYATLWQIQEKLAPILKELKLVIIHFNRWNEVVTQIRDIESNTFIESVLEIWKVESTRTEKWIEAKWKEGKEKDYEIETIEYNDKDPQWVWSIITYYRRYNLLALLDLEIEDDDWAKWWQRAGNQYRRQQAEIYVLTQDDVENKWNGKIYGNSVYINEEKKIISEEQVEKLKKHKKYVELPQKK